MNQSFFSGFGVKNDIQNQNGPPSWARNKAAVIKCCKYADNETIQTIQTIQFKKYVLLVFCPKNIILSEFFCGPQIRKLSDYQEIFNFKEHLKDI